MSENKKTIKEIANKLHDVFDELYAGTMEVKRSDVLANLAGKAINAAKVRHDYFSNKDRIDKLAELED